MWRTREFFYIDRKGGRVGPIPLLALCELYATQKVEGETEVFSPGGGMFSGGSFTQLRETRYFSLVRRIAAEHSPGAASF